jgi:hypothetical protein
MNAETYHKYSRLSTGLGRNTLGPPGPTFFCCRERVTLCPEIRRLADIPCKEPFFLTNKDCADTFHMAWELMKQINDAIRAVDQVGLTSENFVGAMDDNPSILVETPHSGEERK